MKTEQVFKPYILCLLLLLLVAIIHLLVPMLEEMVGTYSITFPLRMYMSKSVSI